MSEQTPTDVLCSSCRQQELVKLGWVLVCLDCDEIEPAKMPQAQPPSA